MHYTCEICGYSTEPAEETPSNWEPSWCCPVCGSDGELFYPEDEEDIR
ncbi:MAG: rubredoxin [Clostridia bacterium]|nr:rubredoxin [Clostridia bacterium]